MSAAYRSFEVEPLHALFGVRVRGLDLSRPLGEAAHAELLEAFDTHSLLVFPGQRLSGEQQVRFSAAFGPLERAITRKAASGAGMHIAHLSNVAEDGSIIAPDDRKQLFHAANRFWHTDSSYKPEPALASLLYAIEVPASGGETEYVSTRAAFRALGPERQAELTTLWAVHDFQRSRDMVAPNLVEPEVQRMLPPVARPLVRVNPRNGERALYIASHAVRIEGMTTERSRTLLDELIAWCTREACIYTHRWTPGDLVMWDNRATMHRGRPWDAARERRVMARTTVIDTGYDREPGIRAA